MAKYLIIAGIALAAIGLIFLMAGKLPWLGKLPGDILVKKENFTFYFPVTTCVIASVILSIILYVFFRK